jgi:prepilin-type N-terminal cleavage/methylation domain-containing protein
MKTIFKSQQGFTLVELVVVIAILGVLGAIAVPFIASYLGESKDRAYDVDRERFQQAVDAFFSRPSSPNFTGKPQYPIMGMSKARGTFVRGDHDHAVDHPNSHEFHDVNHGLASPQSFDHIRIAEDIRQLGNPLGGT